MVKRTKRSDETISRSAIDAETVTGEETTERRRKLNEEALQFRADQQKEIEAATNRNIEREKEWLERKLHMEKEAKQTTKGTSSQPSNAQSVKLHYAFHRRLQRLDPVLEPIRNRGRRLEHIRDK